MYEKGMLPITFWFSMRYAAQSVDCVSYLREAWRDLVLTGNVLHLDRLRGGVE